MSDFERDLSQKLNRSLSHAVPDVKNQILQKCEVAGTSDGVIPMNLKARKHRRPIWANVIAAAAVILLAFQFGFNQSRTVKEQKVETIIDLDVNPSIELRINAADRIIEARAVNQDAQKVLAGMDLSGTQTKVAVNAILGAMLQEGYLSESSNSILISVDAKDETKSEAIQTELVDNVDTMLQACSVNAAILSQSVVTNDDNSKLAADYEISAGRMALIQKILESNSAYELEDLVHLTINELNMIISSQDQMIGNVISVGTVSEAAYIGQAKALTIAFEDQHLDETTIAALESSSDLLRTDVEILNARMVYRVIYVIDDVQYDYKIDALNGEISAFVTGEPTDNSGNVDVSAPVQDSNTDDGSIDDGNDFDNADDEDPENPNTVSGNSVSENEIGDNTVSENSISENSVPDNTVSGNSISENSVSMNSVSMNSVSQNNISGNSNLSGSNGNTSGTGNSSGNSTGSSTGGTTGTSTGHK